MSERETYVVPVEFETRSTDPESAMRKITSYLAGKRVGILGLRVREARPGQFSPTVPATVEGELQFDRLDDNGDVWAAVVGPDGNEDDPGIMVELRSVLGDNWWAAHGRDTSLLTSTSEHLPPMPHDVDKVKVGEHHPAWLRGLVGKKLRITIEELP